MACQGRFGAGMPLGDVRFACTETAATGRIKISGGLLVIKKKYVLLHFETENKQYTTTLWIN